MPPPSSQGTSTAATIASNAGQIDRPAFARTVQIDQVQALGPSLDPVPGHGGRVVAEHRFAAIVPC